MEEQNLPRGDEQSHEHQVTNAGAATSPGYDRCSRVRVN